MHRAVGPCLSGLAHLAPRHPPPSLAAATTATATPAAAAAIIAVAVATAAAVADVSARTASATLVGTLVWLLVAVPPAMDGRGRERVMSALVFAVCLLPAALGRLLCRPREVDWGPARQGCRITTAAAAAAAAAAARSRVHEMSVLALSPC